MKTIAILMAATLALTAGHAAADFRETDDFERDLINEARRDHARAVGGYNDPFTALSNLLAGRATDKDIAPSFGSLHSVPKYRALQGDVVPLVRVQPPQE